MKCSFLESVELSFLEEYLHTKRWYQHKEERIVGAEELDAITVDEEFQLAIISFDFESAPSANYIFLFDKNERKLVEMKEERFLKTLLFHFGNSQELFSDKGAAISFQRIAAGVPPADSIKFKPLLVEASNTLVLCESPFGNTIIKIMRRLQDGINVEEQVGKYLTMFTSYAKSPKLRASADYKFGGKLFHLSTVFEYIQNDGDGWSYTLRELCSLYSNPPQPNRDDVARRMSTYLGRFSMLGKNIASLHLTLAGGEGFVLKERLGRAWNKYVEPFYPKRLTSKEVGELGESIKNIADKAIQLIAKSEHKTPSMKKVLARQDEIWKRIAEIPSILPTVGYGIRQHGDFHLGQIILSNEDFYILDFEGEPLRPYAEREVYHVALRDIAGMLRSFNYALYAALFSYRDKHSGISEDEIKKLESIGHIWEQLVSEQFVSSYLDELKKHQALFLPLSDDQVIKRALGLYKLEKSLYEVIYELNNRPAWVDIPVEGVLRTLDEMEV